VQVTADVARRTRRNRVHHVGQSTVEFALILPLVVACMMCILAAGVMVHDHLALSDLARSATRAAIASDDPHAAAQSVVNANDESVRTRVVIDGDTGLVRVSLTRQRSLPLWIVGQALPRFTVTATVVMLQEPATVIGDGLLNTTSLNE
jgi:Flp pilus assembly protein TadG